ncbi:hypothetical protein I350_06646 [Cryptococcus amylolentus CBS 6273]|uniref:Uncharacterized protein n=1 Tax=Cryptococcus amylolentus CBS 6273 TaxID=1296118 RepID=A0A1E3JGR6_9TREE|nr:hypothetical protein I350_06646 [Cryptococcus amylolentus CBS 6273]
MDSTEAAQSQKDVDSTNSAKWKDFALDRMTSMTKEEFQKSLNVCESYTIDHGGSIEEFYNFLKDVRGEDVTEDPQNEESQEPAGSSSTAINAETEHSSLRSHHLSQSSFATNSIEPNIVDTLSHNYISRASSHSLIEQASERGVGLTLRGELANAAQTGVEEQVGKMRDTVKLLAQGGGTIGPKLTGA